MNDWHSIWNKQKTGSDIEWNGWETEDAAFGELRVSYVARFAEISDRHCVLDIGCGTGTLLRRLPGAVKTGVDFSERQIALAKSSPTGIEFVQGNFLGLAFRRKFDKVICFSCLQYVEPENVDEFIVKAIRLADQDVCFFDVPNLDLKRQNQELRYSKKPDIRYFLKSYFERYSGKITIRDWNLASYRYNHIRFNVRIRVGSH